MRTIGVVDADLEATPLGTTSRQAEDLAGVPVLRRTVERVCRAGRLDEVHVTCPADQADRCRALLSELDARVRPVEADPPAYRGLIRTARKWSLDGWRGGLGGANVLDEYGHGAVVASLAEGASAEAVWVCSGAAAVVDPEFIDGMVGHFADTARQMRFTFAPVAPGLVGTVFESGLVSELSEQHVPAGWLLAYKPDAPQMDLAFKDCCYPSPEPMRHAAGRLIVDTRRAAEAVAELLERHPEPDGETAGRWLLERARRYVPPLPREVEIELTTADQLPETPLRPRGSRVPQRGPIDLDIVAKVSGELGAYDDSLVVLGGFGEPLLHPDFEEVCRILAEAGIYGVAVRTNGLALSDEINQTLMRHRVDVVTVLLDAWSNELYGQLYPGANFQALAQGIDRLSEARVAANQVEPLIAPQITKSRQTVGELDAFFDGWIRKVGCAVIEGFSHYAGQIEDWGVMDMSPPTRRPCRRLRSRCLVLADGRVPLCDQDFQGLTAVGDLASSTLEELWQSQDMRTARQRHDEGDHAALALCEACREWHRP